MSKYQRTIFIIHQKMVIISHVFGFHAVIKNIWKTCCKRAATEKRDITFKYLKLFKYKSSLAQRNLTMGQERKYEIIESIIPIIIVVRIIWVNEDLASVSFPSHSFSHILALHQIHIITPKATIKHI